MEEYILKSTGEIINHTEVLRRIAKLQQALFDVSDIADNAYIGLAGLGYDEEQFTIDNIVIQMFPDGGSKEYKILLEIRDGYTFIEDSLEHAQKIASEFLQENPL